MVTGLITSDMKDGSIARGDRRIIETEAQIIRRIFEEYNSGRSPKSIAHRLNREDIPGRIAENGVRLLSTVIGAAALAS